MDQLEIRAAQAQDIPAILELIRELARYENKLDRVEIDEARLREYVFSDRRCAEILLARRGERVLAHAIFFPVFATFRGRPRLYLEDICVREDARGQGVGRALMVALARLTIERGWSDMMWNVMDWNEPAFAFYDGLGAKKTNGHVTMELGGKALQALAETTNT